MKTCDDIRQQFDPWRDGDLTNDAQAEVGSHLDQCAKCRRWFDAATQLGGDLKVLGLAADRACRVEVRRSDKPDSSESRPGWRRLDALARRSRVAAAIIVLCSVTWLMTARRESLVQPGSRPSTRAAEPARPTPVEPETATFVSLSGNDARWVAPVQSDNPRIHIVWVYGDAAAPTQSEPSDDPPTKPTR